MTIQPPIHTGGPRSDWPHRALYDRVTDALHALPSRFRTALRIAGISATDLFTLNTPLGAAIEQSVVDSLNVLRELWDPNEQYQQYSFVRQAQVFPDVLLQTSAPNVSEEDRILMGIELKGWFVLSKEGEPSFRYKASPAVCAPQDLLVVYPWRLDEVISGSPLLMRPFIEEAAYAAEHRNFYWQHRRGVAAEAAAIVSPANATRYPQKSQKYNDEAARDSGGNFGRVARGGLMTEFINLLLEERVSGISARHWQTFIGIFSEGVSAAVIEQKFDRLRTEAALKDGSEERDALDRIQNGLLALLRN